MTAGSIVTIASLSPPKKSRNVSPKISLYLDKTCTGLRAIARESAKQRSRETTGTGMDELIPSRPDTCLEPEEISRHLQEVVAGPCAKDKTLRINFRSPVASRVSDDAGLPRSWWGSADRKPQTLRQSPSRSWSAEHSGYGTRKGTGGGRCDG